MKVITIPNTDEIDKAAVQFLRLTAGYRKFAFYGPMGSGKTTFIKALCKALDANDVVTSPSFALINEYRSIRNETIYHIDLYRVRDTDELYDLGYEEYFYSDAWCFIEWAEKAEMLLPPSALHVTMEEAGTNKRLVYLDM